MLQKDEPGTAEGLNQGGETEWAEDRHAAHRRAEEHASRKAFVNLVTRPASLSIGGAGGSGDGTMLNAYGLESSSLEFDLGGSLVGSPPATRTLGRVDSPLLGRSPAVARRSLGLVAVPTPGLSSSQQHQQPSPPSPRTRAMTEEELFQQGYESYLPISLSSDGTRNDPRDHLFDSIPEPFIESDEYQKVIITETSDAVDEDTTFACTELKRSVLLREKYISAHPSPPQDQLPPFRNQLRESGVTSPKRDRHPNDFRRRAVPPYDVWSEPVPGKWERADDVDFVTVQGVMHVIPKRQDGSDDNGPAEERGTRAAPHEGVDFSSVDAGSTPRVLRKEAVAPKGSSSTLSASLFPVIPFDEFLLDYTTLRRSVFSGPVSSYSYTRLELLSARYQIHVMLNETRELVSQKSVPHRDFYNVRKVDTHVHHSACMSQKHLLRYIKHKLRFDPHEVVIEREGKQLTLGEVFMSLRLTAYDLSIDTLDMHAHNTFNRFDRFNLKYNPAGQSRLREIFLKTDNFMKGKYLAEITREVMGDLEASKYQLVEWRISIYGRKATEWDNLSAWFNDNKLAHPNVRWLIQIPRLFANYRQSNEVSSFQQFLDNIFRPLFLVTADPSSNLPLHYFLQTIVGIDSVDDESKPEHGHLNGGAGSVPTPDMWTAAENPPYGYWMYYMYANLVALNKFRASRGLCTFEFRPHCGEAGDIDHLVSTYMLADKINHGILLRKNAALCYLYYLSQIGIAMSPLSNNKLFLDYHKNPFPRYFQQGLNVSLSTDDPLMLHYTKDPLLEEFSVAAQVWKLSSADQCEIARNSVLQSGWERRYKLHFLGQDYSDIRETNVPKIRLLFRSETLAAELDLLDRFKP